MTKKRSRSPSDDSHRQRKMHVGIKELNESGTKDDYMKEIYAKTLNKLFEGGKKIQTPAEKVEDSVDTKEKHTLKQTFLDNKCQLQLKGKEIQDDFCVSCDRQGCTSVKCYFCEKIFSECKVNTCEKCEQQYCSSCLFTEFEGEEGSYVCRSCY